MSSQRTRHQKLNSYSVMNSLGDNLSTQQRYPPQLSKYINMYVCIMNIYVPHEVKYQRALSFHSLFEKSSQLPHVDYWPHDTQYLIISDGVRLAI